MESVSALYKRFYRRCAVVMQRLVFSRDTRSLLHFVQLTERFTQTEQASVQK